MSAQLALLPEYLTAHLQLSLLALLIGAAVSIPLGVVVTRVSWLEQPVLGVASVIQTIPSLALLAVMVPILGAIQLQSIGYLPAFIGLTLYSVLPILRNTVTGLTQVDPALIEAAQGVGMTPKQQLWRVELPLAMPVIVAGVRTSTVWIVGIATLSTPVGATSLGNYIFTGLQTRNYAAVLMGCIAAAALALLLDGLVWILENGVRQRRRTLVTLSLGMLGLLYVYTALSFAFPLLASREKVVTIGSKTFTEQYILSEILARKIEQDTDLSTRVVESLGSTVAFDALVSGAIDVYIDYSGTLWATVMHRQTVAQDRQKVLLEIRDWLESEHDLRLIGPLGFENAYVLAVRQEDAERLGIDTISDLRVHAPDMVIGGDYEFFGRPEWEAIRRTYGLSFEKRRRMDSSLMYQAVDQGDVDVIAAFSTDGRIDALGLRVLEDDRNTIPPYDAIMLAVGQLPKEAVDALSGLQNTISADEMRQMNRAVDEGKKSPAEAAEDFLRGHVSALDGTSIGYPGTGQCSSPGPKKPRKGLLGTLSGNLPTLLPARLIPGPIPVEPFPARRSRSRQETPVSRDECVAPGSRPSHWGRQEENPADEGPDSSAGKKSSSDGAVASVATAGRFEPQGRRSSLVFADPMTR